MKYKVHPYQAYATNFILEHPIAAILLDMGLGKSVITLTAINQLIQQGQVHKVLVIHHCGWPKAPGLMRSRNGAT